LSYASAENLVSLLYLGLIVKKNFKKIVTLQLFGVNHI